MIWLTDNEVAELTGYKAKSCQIRWLKDNHVRHFVSASGHPRVMKSYLEQEPVKRRNLPNLEAL